MVVVNFSTVACIISCVGQELGRPKWGALRQDLSCETGSVCLDVMGRSVLPFGACGWAKLAHFVASDN